MKARSNIFRSPNRFRRLLAAALLAAPLAAIPAWAQEAPRPTLCQVAGRANCNGVGDVFYGNVGSATRVAGGTGLKSTPQLGLLRADGAIQSGTFGIAGKAGAYLGAENSRDFYGDFRVVLRDNGSRPALPIGLTYGLGGRVARSPLRAGGTLHEVSAGAQIGLSRIDDRGRELAVLIGGRENSRITRRSDATETNVREVGPSLTAALLTFRGTVQLECGIAARVDGKLKGDAERTESPGGAGGCELFGQSARRKVGPISAAVFGSYGLHRRAIATQSSPGALSIGRENASALTLGLSVTGAR